MNQPPDSTAVENRLREAIQSGPIVHHLLEDNATFPNNGNLPLLIYQSTLVLPGSNPAVIVEQLFGSNGWNGSWRNGIYSFHHYHSTAHEVLGVYSGSAKVQLGGEDGVCLTASRGDVIIIPAGVAHKNLGADSDFRLVGAYPEGQSPDMRYGKSGERPQSDHNISNVPLPQKDPVYGPGGPLASHWKIPG